MSSEIVDKKETYVLFRIWRTLKQMCNDRGYLVLDEDLSITLEQWKERFGDKPITEQKPMRRELTFLVQHQDDESNRLYVFFPDNDKVSIDDLKTYHKKMKEGSVRRGIIAYRTKITPMARMGIQEMKPDFHLEQFTELELMVNITEHMYVPKHTVLSDADKAIILERYKMSEDQVPRIQESDPISRYFGMTSGQMLKIVRVSQTAGRYVTYRICMN
mmetsp:Transcript_20361/g.52857  ORF Transcript_20361/g.52857 Transcript_20361/m.52857 type:complete len:217 (-) Transcript_20361:108-758(-)